VVGGVFYPMSGPFPDAHRGAYYFGEYCQAEIRQLDPDTGAVRVFASGLTPWVVDLDIGPDGALYFSKGGRNTEGGIYRVVVDRGDRGQETGRPATG
jgi:streptogramin lyase